MRRETWPSQNTCKNTEVIRGTRPPRAWSISPFCPTSSTLEHLSIGMVMQLRENPVGRAKRLIHTCGTIPHGSVLPHLARNVPPPQGEMTTETWTVVHWTDQSSGSVQTIRSPSDQSLHIIPCNWSHSTPIHTAPCCKHKS